MARYSSRNYYDTLPPPMGGYYQPGMPLDMAAMLARARMNERSARRRALSDIPAPDMDIPMGGGGAGVRTPEAVTGRAPVEEYGQSFKLGRTMGPYSADPFGTVEMNVQVPGAGMGAFEPVPAPPGPAQRLQAKGWWTGKPELPQPRGFRERDAAPMRFLTLPAPGTLAARLGQGGEEGLKDLGYLMNAQTRAAVDPMNAQTRRTVGTAQADNYQSQADSRNQKTPEEIKALQAGARSREAYANRAENWMAQAEYESAIAKRDYFEQARAKMLADNPDVDTTKFDEMIGQANGEVQRLKSQMGGGAQVGDGGAVDRANPDWQALKAAFPDMTDDQIDEEYRNFRSGR